VTNAANPELVWIDAANPTVPRARIPIAGLQPGELITGLDARPATGALYALTSTNRLVVLDSTTGATSPAGISLDPTLLASAPAGFDFNPTVDRLRLVSAANDNLRWNPATTTPVDGDALTPGVQPDADLTFIAGDPNAGQDPAVVAAAYDRSDNDGATPSTLFAFDAERDALLRQGATDGNAGVGAVPGPPLAGLAILPGGAIRAASGATIAGEGSAQAVVTLERSGDTLAATRIAFRRVDVSATGGSDYTAVSGTLEFPQGARSAQIAIPLQQDAAFEGAEALVLAFDPPAAGAVVETRHHVVQLQDDDPPPAGPPLQPVPDPTPVVLVAPDAPVSLAALRRSGRLRAEVVCSEACTGRATLRLGRTPLGSRAITLLQAGVAKVTVRLDRKARRALARAARKPGRATLRLVVTVRDAAGQSGGDTARLRVARR
jgi:hypothetical protein